MIARHNFSPVNFETDLALHKGEQYEIIDCSGVWWMARDRKGCIGLIPFNYVEELCVEEKIGDKIQNEEEFNVHPSIKCSSGFATINNHNQNNNARWLPNSKSTSNHFHLTMPPTTNNTNKNNKHNCLLLHHHHNWLLEPSNFTLKHSWYFPNVDRDSAEVVLKHSDRDGTFLIRPSTTENRCFTLSLLYKRYIFCIINY